VLLGELRHPFEECQLIVEIVVSTVEPKPRTDCAVNSRGPRTALPKSPSFSSSCFGNTSIPSAVPAPFTGIPSFSAKPEIRRRHCRAGAVAPRRSTGERAPALLQCRFHLLLLQFPLQLAEVFERLLVVAGPLQSTCSAGSPDSSRTGRASDRPRDAGGPSPPSS